MNKIILFFLLIFISSCSLNTGSDFWTKTEKIKKEKKLKKNVLFKKNTLKISEVNPNLKINLDSKNISNNFSENLNNNIGRVNYKGKLDWK